MEPDDSTLPFSYHKKIGPCYTRPAYRDSRRKTSVKVYTLLDESCYLLLFGIPALDLSQNLRNKFKDFGSIESLITLGDYPNKEIFTDVFLVKFDDLRSARIAKRKLDDTTFYGGNIHACYAPEYETIADCRLKLYNSRRINAHISRKAEYEYSVRMSATSVPCIPKISMEQQQSNSTPNLTISNINARESVSSTFSAFPGTMGVVCNTIQNQSYSSGDAIEDSRNYWRNMGFNFCMNSPSSSNQSSIITASNFNQIHSIGSVHLDSTISKRSTIPLPVLQALSCRPYLENVSENKQSSNKNKNNSNQNTDFRQLTDVKKPNCFVPRVLHKKTTPTILSKNESKILSNENKSEILINSSLKVGELKRLAFVLGPEQGPCLPSSEYVHRRIVYHRPKIKRSKLDQPTSDM